MRTAWRRSVVAVPLLLLVLSPRAAVAQKPTFELEGVVTDAQQAVLPGATVTIRNVSTGLTRSSRPTRTSRFVFASLPPEGRYTLQTELSGFASEVREELVFNAGQRRPERLAEAVERAGDDHRRR